MPILRPEAPSRLDKLSRPIGSLIDHVTPGWAEDSIEVAAARMRDEGIPALPFVHEDGRIGQVSSRELARAIAESIEPTASIGLAFPADAITLTDDALGAEALRALENHQVETLVVVDHRRRILGVLSAANLVASDRLRNRPRLVGGMATPFGVYLTNGVVSGGAGLFALVATGALLFSLFTVSSVAAMALVHLGLRPYLDKAWLGPVFDFSSLVFFFVFLRSLPIAGIHAAEHMTVHAIERGESLEVSTVARMPRIHPRCGTNLAVGAMLFLGIMSWDAIPDAQIRLVVAGLATLALWRPLGAIAQRYITTKPANRKQVEMGIAAGKDLLAKARNAPPIVPNLGRRLLASGMLNIMLGAALAHLLFTAAAYLIGLPEPWRGILIPR